MLRNSGLTAGSLNVTTIIVLGCSQATMQAPGSGNYMEKHLVQSEIKPFFSSNDNILRKHFSRFCCSCSRNDLDRNEPLYHFTSVCLVKFIDYLSSSHFYRSVYILVIVHRYITSFISRRNIVPHVTIFTDVSITGLYHLHNSINSNVFYQLPRVQSASKLRRIVVYVKDLDKDLQVKRKKKFIVKAIRKAR